MKKFGKIGILDRKTLMEEEEQEWHDFRVWNTN